MSNIKCPSCGQELKQDYYDGELVYKISEFGARCEYVAKKKEFMSLSGYSLLYMGSDEYLKSIYYTDEAIIEELLK